MTLASRVKCHLNVDWGEMNHPLDSYIYDILYKHNVMLLSFKEKTFASFKIVPITRV